MHTIWKCPSSNTQHGKGNKIQSIQPNTFLEECLKQANWLGYRNLQHVFCQCCLTQLLWSAGKLIQMNRMPTPGGDEGGGAQARVNVLAELPLLEARLDAPSLRITDADQSQVATI